MVVVEMQPINIQDGMEGASPSWRASSVDHFDESVATVNNSSTGGDGRAVAVNVTASELAQEEFEKPVRISVVIPTTGRPAVRQAVISAINQTLPPMEVIVAIDRADGQLPSSLEDLQNSFRPIWTGGMGPSGARMQGAMAAEGEIVAFLDDDDVWVPEKLACQMAARASAPRSRFTVVSSRLVHCRPDGEFGAVGPDLLFTPDQRMASYLFRRTQIRYSQSTIHPSTVICDRALLAEVPWDNQFRLHEDWDWLLRIGDRADTQVIMVPDVLSKVAIGDPGSLSNIGEWQDSRSWAEGHAHQLSKRELGDFLLCYPVAMAARAGNYRAALAMVRYVILKARPGIYAWLVSLLYLASPALVRVGSRLLIHIKNRHHHRELSKDRR